MFTAAASDYRHPHADGAADGRQQRQHNFRNANRRHPHLSEPGRGGWQPDRQENSELVEFLSNFSLHCYRWLAPSGNQNGWVVTLWLIVHLSAAVFIGVILVQAYNEYSTHPLVTTLADTLYPVAAVPFPAISVCPNNRLSRRLAQLYAAELYSIETNRTSTSDATTAELLDLLNNIRQMGKLIDSDWDNDNDMNAFQAYLERYDSNETFYNTNAHMRALVPQCADLMLKCSWRGVEQPCLQRGLMFEQRRTQYGHCCTFNYVRTDALTTGEQQSIRIDDTGPDLGLILLLNGTAADYFYPLYNFVGFIVQVFNPNEFPDVPSGSVSERVVELGYETFIRIDSTTLVSEHQAQRYAPETRGCLFTDELADKFGGRYKRSDCVVNCRIASIIALCSCTMYYLPSSQMANAEEQERRLTLPPCTLEHVPCLSRYRIKWSTMLLSHEHVVGLEVEQEDGLYCPECLPSCSDTTYVVSSQDLPLVPTHRREPNWLSNVPNVSDVALIRIYLGQPETWLYEQKVSLAWYEIISNIGGMCGVVSGFSLISLAEMFYYVTRRICLRYGSTVSCRCGERHSSNSEMVLIILP